MSTSLVLLSFFLTLIVTFFSAYFASKKNKNAENLWIFTVIIFILNSLVGAIHLAFPSNYYAMIIDLVFQYNFLLAILGYFWYKAKEGWTIMLGSVFTMQVVFSWLMLAFGVPLDAFKIMVCVFHQIEMVVIVMASIYYVLQSTFDPQEQAIQR